MKKIALLILCAVLLLSAVACGAGVSTWQEQYDLGVRYLSDGNYEEAIIAFTAAIEIEPKRAEAYAGRGDAYMGSGATSVNLAAALADYEKALENDEGCADAYLGLAEVYIANGDFEKAREILERGIEKTGDERLSARLDEVNSGNISDYWGRRRRASYYDGNGALRCYFEYTYGADGRRSSATGYDAAGNQVQRVEEQYDKEGREIYGVLMFHIYDGHMDTGTTAYDEEGRRVEERFDSGGCWTYSYNAEEKLAEKKTYGDDGALDWCITYEYGDGYRRENNCDADGVLKYYQIYYLNEAGKTSRMEEYKADGSLSWYEIWERDADGKHMATYRYDADGSLTSSSTYD